LGWILKIEQCENTCTLCFVSLNGGWELLLLLCWLKSNEVRWKRKFYLVLVLFDYKAGLLRNRFYYYQCVVAVNAKWYITSKSGFWRYFFAKCGFSMIFVERNLISWRLWVQHDFCKKKLVLLKISWRSLSCLLTN